MNHYLIINPNTSKSVTSKLLRAAQDSAPPATRVTARTASFGSPYISTEASYAVAGHAVLEAWQQQAVENADKRSAVAFSGVLIGCFGDPGLWALREASNNVQVTGLALASFEAAARIGRFAIVTGGARWRPMLERLSDNLGFSQQLQTIHTLEFDGAQLAANPKQAAEMLTAACQEVAKNNQLDAIILGGAGLYGYANDIRKQLSLPLIDSVEAGIAAMFNVGGFNSALKK